MSIGKQLEAARKRAGISQRALAVKADVDRTYIVQVENGRIANPGTENMRRLATALGVPLSELVRQPETELATSENMALAGSARGTMRATATASEIAAEVVKQLRSEEPPQFLPAIDPEHDPRLRHPRPVLRLEQRIPASESWPTAEEYPVHHERTLLYEITVRGDCMTPAINDGDSVWIDATRQADVNNVVAVDMQGEWMLKRLRRRNGVWRLVPDNTAYDAIDVASNQVRVLGVVVKIIKDPT